MLGIPANDCLGDINWDGDNAVGNFSFNNNWFGDTQPTWGFGSGNLVFSFRNNASQSSLFYDYGQWRDINDIIWASTFPAGLSLSSSGNGINFNQRLENRSSQTQTVNMPLSGAKNGASQIELNPVNGDLILNGSIFNDNNKPFQVFGTNGKTLTVNTVISGPSSVSFTIQQASSVVFKQANTFSGDTIINAGTLILETGGSITNSNIKLGATSGSDPATISLNVSGGGFSLDAQSIEVRSGSAGAKTIQSTNTSGTNTVLPSITRNATLVARATSSTGSLQFTGNIGGGARMTVTGSGTTSITGVLSGGGDLLKQGSSTLRMDNTNPFSPTGSNVFMDEGAIIANATGALGATNGTSTGTVNMGASGTAGLNTTLSIGASGVTLANPVDVRYLQTGAKTISTVMTSGSGTFSGKLFLHDHVTLAAAPGSTAIFSGVIERAGSAGSSTPASDRYNTNTPSGGFNQGPGVIINGGGSTGTVEFRAVNTYPTETIVNAGTLQFNSGGNSNAGGSIRLHATSAINIADVAGGNSINNTLNPRPETSGTKYASSTNTSGTNTYSGVIAMDDALTTVSTHAGATLAFTNSFQLKTFTATVAGSGATNISGVVSSTSASGGFVKQGSGALTLSNANTYTGTTTVSEGSLLATNTTGSATGTGEVSVASGATLGGTGTIGGSALVNGTLAPGLSVGRLNFSDNLTLSSTATLAIELGGDHTQPATAYDQVRLTTAGKTVTLQNGAKLNIIGISAIELNQPYTVITTSTTGGGATLGTFATLLFNGLPLNENVDYSVAYNVGGGQADVTVTFESVPEPSGPISIALFAASGLLCRRRGLSTCR